MSTLPKRPKTVNRLQRLITEWERESGQPVRRLNLRVASMMLAGALRRAVDDDGAVVFVTRGGVAMELRAGEKARVTGDVDLILRGDPESLLAHLDASRGGLLLRAQRAPAAGAAPTCLQLLNASVVALMPHAVLNSTNQ